MVRSCDTKMFCSGAVLVDYALVTVGVPEKLLIESSSREYDVIGIKLNSFAAFPDGQPNVLLIASSE